MTKAKLRMRKADSFFFTITENLVKIKFDEYDGDYPFVDVDFEPTLSEKDFYKMFLYMRSAFVKTLNYSVAVDKALTAVNIEYLATIMSKDMDFTIPSKAKNNAQAELAHELGKNPQSVYSAIHRLRRGGFLVKTEDQLIEPSPELQSLRKVTKAHIAKLGIFPVSYLMNIVVSGVALDKEDFTNVTQKRSVNGKQTNRKGGTRTNKKVGRPKTRSKRVLSDSSV